MYKLILIDADNTLFDYDKAEAFALQSSLNDFGVTKDLEQIQNDYRAINKAMWQLLEKGQITKEALSLERFNALFEKHALTIRAKDFSQTYLRYLGQSSFLIKDAESIIKYLYEHYTVVIVTNGIKQVQYARMENSAIKDYHHGMVVSEDIGVSKPDPAFFEYALSLAKHRDKKSVLIIGDSLSSDIQGGINFGIDTCWYNYNHSEPELPIVPTYQIHALKEIMMILTA